MRLHGLELDATTLRSLGTVAAILLSAVAILVSVRQQRIESRLRLRAQAARVFFYVSEMQETGGQPSKVMYRIDNNSDLPIRTLELILVHHGSPHEVLPAPFPSASDSVSRGRILYPGQRITVFNFISQWSETVLRPHGTAYLEVMLDLRKIASPERKAIALAFTDASGRRWKVLDHRRSKQSGLTGDTGLTSESGVAGDDLPVVKISRDTRDGRRERGAQAHAAYHGRP